MQHTSDIAPDAIRGVVADVVRAPELLEVAVEAALGDRLGGVLVSEPDVGVAAIGFLKQGGGGRSAFVPLETRSAVPHPVVHVETPGAGTRVDPASGPVRFEGVTSPVARFEGARFEGEGGAASWMSPAWPAND